MRLAAPSPRALAAGLAVAAALAAHGPALRAPLVDNDSFAVVYSQEALGTSDALPDLVSPRYFTRFGVGGWRPLSTLAYCAAFRAFGVEPFAYKLLKLSLHAASAALVFAIGVLLLGDRAWALAGAAAYFLRLRQPAFEGLAFFPDYLSAFFALAAALNHLRGQRGAGGLATGALYSCALLSKESALPLPLLLVLTHACFPRTRPGTRRTTARSLAPAALAALAYLAASKWLVVSENFYGPAVWTPRGPASRILLAYAAYWREFFAGVLAAAFAALALVRACAGGRDGRGRWLAFGLGWTALGLWSALNVWPSFPRFADYLAPLELRFLALPGAAMAWVFAWAGASGRAGRAWNAAAWALAAAWLASAAWDAPVRSAAGLAGEAGRDAAALASGSWTGPLYRSALSRAALSLPLIRRDDPRLAAELEASLRRALPASDAGALLAFFGDDSLYRGWKARLAAELMNQESLPALLSRLTAETAYRRGETALARGDAAAAADAFRAALAADPEHEASCLGLAAAFQEGGQPRKAEARLRGCRDDGLLLTEFPPEGAERAAVTESARAFSRALGAMRLAEALRAFDALRDRMGPQWRLDLRMSRASALARAGRYRLAEKAYERALRAAPSAWRGRAAAERELARLKLGSRERFELAMRRFAEGDRVQAIAEFGEALRLSPDFAEAYLSRGSLYADEGRWEEATRDYEAGLRQPAAAENPILKERLESAFAAANRRDP